MAGAINFIQANPAVSSFNSGMQAQQAQDLAAEDAMRRRVTFDRGIRTDRALNTAIDSVVAGAPTPTATPAPAVQDTAAITTAPAPAGGASAPAMPAAPATAAPAAAPRMNRMDLARRIGNVPGAGQMRFNMVNQQVGADEQRANQVADKVYDLLKTNNPQSIALAQQLATQNGMQIPPQIFSDATARAQLLGMLDYFNKMGLKGAQIPAYFKSYQEGQGSEQERVVNAAASVPASSPRVVRTIETAQGIFGVTEDGTTVPMQGPGGQTLTPTPKRYDYNPTRGSGGDNAYDRKYQAWLKAHPGDEQGALRYAGGLTPKDRPPKSAPEIRAKAVELATREAAGAVRPWSSQQLSDRVSQIEQLLQIEATSEPAPSSQSRGAAAAPGAPAPAAGQSPGGRGATPARALPPGIPPGSKQIGTSQGKPVYEAPGGKRYIVE